MGLLRPSKAIKDDAAVTAAITDKDRTAQRNARDERQRRAEWQAACTSRCHCGRPAPRDLPCDKCLSRR